MWFEGKVCYEKIAENGMNKKVTEPYLVDALSFTEAESRLIEELTSFVQGEFSVSDIKRANYSELFPSDKVEADKWYKCKLNFITLDEKSGEEKKKSTYMLVQATDLRDAIKNLDEKMKGTMSDYEISSVAETAIMDVYLYQPVEEDDPEFENYDNEKLSDAARVCMSLALSDKDKKVIGSSTIHVLDAKYGCGNGIKLIKQLIRKGFLQRDQLIIYVGDKPMESFDWYKE